MGLAELNIKKHYSSDSDDILKDFYIPVLQESIKYDRLAGFFSSSSLAVAARGIVGLIDNGGKMKLIVSPRLSEQDVKIIKESYEKPEKYIENKMLFELDNLKDKFTFGHLQALGWLLANKKLDIKIAIPFDKNNIMSYEDSFSRGIFHLKIGILKDVEGDTLAFSGSVNESASGWLENIEEFKVFRSWEPKEEEYLKADILKFENYWEDKSTKVKAIQIPDAIEKKLIEFAPSQRKELDIREYYPKFSFRNKEIKLYDYQNEAISSWIDRGKKGIFEMATGTGKTFTALGCVKKIFSENKNILIIITCPYSHLIDQWNQNIDLFNFGNTHILIADGRSSKWKKRLTEYLLDASLPYKDPGNIILLTTHNTFSSADLIKIINSYSENKIMLIADEMHWLGASTFRKGLLEKYTYRLGLSATPRRWFDDIGTTTLYKYFGESEDKKITYNFSLEDAICKINPATGETFLTPYYFYPIFVNLSKLEIKRYNDLTLSYIWKLRKVKNKVEEDDILERILFQRANIVKNAEEKYLIFGQLLDKLKSEGKIDHLIVYCTPEQLDKVYKIISSRGIISHTFTMEESNESSKKYGGLSERQYLLKKFDEGKYQALVAIKCLDEGVDVPSAKMAILMGSSGNPREYIQRIGRVIRRYKTKEYSTIYDLIIFPNLNYIDPNIAKLEKNIFDKEIKRYWEIAKLAINNADALNILIKIKEKID